MTASHVLSWLAVLKMAAIFTSCSNCNDVGFLKETFYFELDGDDKNLFWMAIFKMHGVFDLAKIMAAITKNRPKGWELCKT